MQSRAIRKGLNTGKAPRTNKVVPSLIKGEKFARYGVNVHFQSAWILDGKSGRRGPDAVDASSEGGSAASKLSQRLKRPGGWGIPVIRIGRGNALGRLFVDGSYISFLIPFGMCNQGFFLADVP